MWNGFKEEENELSWSGMNLVEIVEVEGMLDVVIKGTYWYAVALHLYAMESIQSLLREPTDMPRRQIPKQRH